MNGPKTPTASHNASRATNLHLVHAVGGLVLFVIATVLFKPWGKTAYGKRRLS